MSNYIITVNGKRYNITKGSLETKKERDAIFRKLNINPDDYNITVSNNGYSYSLTSKQKKKLQPRNTAAVRNQRRNNYNETAKYYGFNSRDDVRNMLKFLKSLGYKIGDFGVNGVDGYMGGMTEAAYIDAWQKNPELMKLMGFKEPATPGTGTVKVGNRTVMDTDQNRQVANKVRNADEFVNKNYGSDKLFQMFTLGATKLLSPTLLYGVGRELFDDNYSFGDMANEWLTGENKGIFQSWNAGEQWAAENPRLASAINTGTDILTGVGVTKLLPKGRAYTRGFMRDIKTGARSNGMPYARMSEHVGGSASYGPHGGNPQILLAEAENVSMRPGTFLTAKVSPSGHIAGPNTELARTVNITPTFGTSGRPMVASRYTRMTPYGSSMYVFPFHSSPQGTISGLGETSAGDFTIDGLVPYQETWYKEPTLDPDATQF